jgi:hypothetical protein
MKLLTNIFNYDIIIKNNDKVKKTRKLIEKALFVLLLIATSITGIKAQKISPSALSIRDGTSGNEYSLEDWIDIYSSNDLVGGKNKDGYVYYVTNGGIKLWEPPSSFQSHFWRRLNSVAQCKNWTIEGKNFIPENEMNNLSWREIITYYCVIDYDSWNKDQIKVFGWSHDKSQKNSKIVPSSRASHPKEGKLCFNTAAFDKVSAPQELIPIRSTRCTNPLDKKLECYERKTSSIQKTYPSVVYTPSQNCTCPQQQPQFVYVPQRHTEQYYPQQTETRVTNTSFGISVGFLGGGNLQPVYQPQYYPQPQPQYYPQQPPPQPSWGNPNPTLGTGYVDNGGPVLGNGGIPQTGGPTFGNGGIPINGNPTYGNSGFSNGNPTYGNSGFSNGNPNYGGGGISTGGSVLGNGGVSTGGPSFGNGGNPSLGNGRP